MRTTKAQISLRSLISTFGVRCLGRGARWLSGSVSDSGARGRGFETYRRRVVSLSKTLYSPKVLVNYPGKRWLRPNMTEKLLTGTLSLNTNKQKNRCLDSIVPLLSIYRLSARWSYPPPPLGNFADIPYLKEQSFLHRIRDVCTLQVGA